jgi:hypothetical protein
MQEQTKTHTGHGSQGDDNEKFETSPHRTLTGIAGFDHSQHQGSESRESVRSPFGLRQGEQHRHRWYEAGHFREPYPASC